MYNFDGVMPDEAQNTLKQEKYAKKARARQQIFPCNVWKFSNSVEDD